MNKEEAGSAEAMKSAQAPGGAQPAGNGQPVSQLKIAETPAAYTSPQILYDELISTIRRYHPSDDLSLIHRAYMTAKNAHMDQKRKSGEPYIIHPICVAIILANLELDKETIIAGLLHDVVEDTILTAEQISRVPQFCFQFSYIRHNFTPLKILFKYRYKTLSIFFIRTF